MEDLDDLINEKTKILAVVHASNTLGTINPVEELITIAHNKGIPVLLDGAQAAAHIPINVKELDVDFYTFSAHKLYGPTGIGGFYGKMELLEKMQPYQGGGEMIKEVTFKETTYNDIPFKFEAGTPNIADVIAYKQAIEFINSIGRKNIGDR